MSENARGKATSGKDGTDNNSTECPTCGRVFEAESSMKIHHTQAHGESLSDVVVACGWCDSEFTMKEYHRDKTTESYCSEDCRSKAMSDRSDPTYNRKTVDCDTCGDNITRAKSQLSEHNFCSKECYYQHRSDYYRGEKSNLWSGGKNTSDCEYCGTRFEHQDPQRFCSRSCYGAWLSENKTGKDSPAWGGGYTEYYGPNWESQRNQARKRDGFECQYCGSKEDELEKQLSVHHIMPFRECDGYKEANKLENLVSLCNTCHGLWEGLYLRPDTHRE